MKLLFLHGAIKNSGDFLIAHRSRLLIQNIVPMCEIISFWEGTDFSKKENFEILKDCDGIVFGGGPFFTNNIHPKDVPLISDISKLNKPMINIGGGWYGRDNKYNTIKNYAMNEKSIDLLKMIESSSGELSCRDWFTVNMLKEKGFNAALNGCPAWYDLDYLDKTNFNLPRTIRTICISDPANSKNAQALVNLLGWIRAKYSNAKIIMVFHRGINEQSPIYRYLKQFNIDSIDISGGHKGFAIYDSCDLHIGFRVHAHIYNLSHRNFSILIEEDGRGAGVNHALGLTSVRAYEDLWFNSNFARKVEYKFAYKLNSSMVNELDSYINRVYYTNGLEYIQAFEKMRFYFTTMKQHIERIIRW